MRPYLLFVIVINLLKLNCFLFIYNTSKNIFPKKGIVENIGVEPMTSCVQGRRSSQLS